ncbi:hypothetical protein GCM10023223_29840 [Stackebrandtia albiflava]
MTAYTRCPDCRTPGRGTTDADTANRRDAEDPQPCPRCDGTGCVPFQGYVLAVPEQDR